MEFNQTLYDEILSICDIGDQLIEDTAYEEGIKKYKEALALIPEPKNQLEATTWIYAAIGDVYFIQGNFKQAREHFMEALNYRGGMTNAFILLRVGQCWYKLGNEEKAIKFLTRAYNLEGDAIFLEEDPCYLQFLQAH